MAGNTSSIQILSCDDSPLSTTGNIIGILTLAYAIFVTAIFYATRILDAEKDLQEFGHRFLDEFTAFESVAHWLQSVSHLIPDELQPEASQSQQYHHLENLAHKVRADLAEKDSLPLWILLGRRGYFLAQKVEAEDKLKQIVQLRKKRQMFCLRVTQAIIIKQTGEQNERMHLQREIMRLQDALIFQLRAQRASSELHLQDN
ncbi:hypothetical protein N7517_001945 [Penicillium concentricum]|uniref:Uncharacterized protein n=1 Tax=Penicillium concentricum TaxID=293559 RepID=A0A9W9SUY8_9EURO|nr:uncharacterized protein N7517_001945 [Penicillium concentricum]KAJ5384034.1 hypothetical protein N7517_001945 [Penicillium concentricum]